MNSDWAGIIWFFVLILGNGFFVGAEFAVISARRAQIEPRAEAGSKPAKITIKAMEQVALMLSTAQLGITICSLLLLIIVEPSIHHLLEPLLHGFGFPESAISVTSFVTALIIVSFFHIVIGEMVPKNIALSLPERAALIMAPILYGIAQVVRPIVWVLNGLSNLILRVFRVKVTGEISTAYTLDQVEDIVEHSTREGALSDVSGALSNTFEFTEKKVQDIAVPVEKIISFNETATPRDLEQAVAKHGFSRYLLTNQHKELIGYLHLKDVLDLDKAEADKPFPAKRIRSLITLAASTELEDALARMRRGQAHMAKSVDAAGKVQGVLFLEDILEELVGEVQDATRR